MFDSLVFRQLFDAASSTYTYVLGDPVSHQAVIIDTVFERHLRDRALLAELGLNLVAAIDTHCHADHVTGAWLMRQATGCSIGISRRYQPPIEGADRLLDQGDRIAFGARYLEARATPGHTDGCLTLVLDDLSMVFTGDALLIEGCGRTDFQNGDARALYHSVRGKLFALPDDTLVYPGHDYKERRVSSIAQEKARNPRLGGEQRIEAFEKLMAELGLAYPKFIDYAVPGNRACGECPGGVPEALQQYCEQIGHSQQG